MPGCAAYQVRSTLTSLPLGFTLRKCTGGKKKALALAGHVSSDTTYDHKMNTPFFQVPRPEFEFLSGRHRVPVCTRFL